ncbi:MAG: universal stress protein [Candidatus Eremiobacteraeota bacterium]|nr:universal stress protein [Candidatus Eremiobacteraeota bacterium]
MYSKILVPLDGSELAEQALAPAGELARRFGAELYLVRVFLPPVISPAAWTSIDMTKVRAEEEQFLRNYLDEQQVEGVLCHRLLIEGEAADALMHTAKEQGIDLIVMTSHGRTGFNRWLFGSVAERVVRHAPCPVLTIGPDSLKRAQSA